MNLSTNGAEDASFLIRSYGKGELAQCYIHGVMPQTAVKQFNAWIHKSPGLKERLYEKGMGCKDRRYTPAQVQLIVEALGAP